MAPIIGRRGGRGVARRALLLGTAGIAAPALAQPRWPQERVTIVTSLPAGSTVDITCRIYADRLAQVWGKPVVIDNRGGANGVIACQAVARARADGHTLLGTSAMTHAANPSLYQRLPYDPVADFDAVARFGSSPFALMATRGLGTTTLAALTARLRAEPGRHNFAEGTVPGRIAAEKYRQLIGADVVHLGYRGNQAAFPDLVNGRVSFMAVDVVGAKPLIDRGDVHALCLSDSERHHALPGLMTSAEAGLPEYVFTTWSGIYAPKGTPGDVIKRIHQDMTDAWHHPETNARIQAIGGSRVPPMGPEEFQSFTISEIAAWGRVIRQAGIRLD